MTVATPRIVSLLPAATEMICGAGLGDRLVGVSHECNWPPEVRSLPRLTRSRIDSTGDSASIDSQVRQLAAAGEALYEVDSGLLASLRPTLIVTQSQCDVCAVSHASIVQIIADNPDLASCAVLALNPLSLGEVLADIERIGAAGGGVEEARRFTEELRLRIEAVKRRAAADDRRRPRIAVIEWIEPLLIAGNWTPELIELAGGTSGLAEAGRHSRYVTWDELAAFAPEAIIVAPCGFDLERSRREASRLITMPHWPELPAVREVHVTVVDGDAHFNRPGPRLVDSLELVRFAIERASAIE